MTGPPGSPKLILLPFAKSSADTLLWMVEVSLLYLVQKKLDFFVPIQSKSLSKRGAQGLSLDNPSLDQLQALSHKHRCRYLLSGAIRLSPMSAHDAPTKTLQVSMQLYDAREDRYLVSDTQEWEGFGSVHINNGPMQLTLDPLYPMVNWICFHIVNSLLPKQAMTLLPTMAEFKVTSSFDALRALMKAENLDNNEEKVTAYQEAARSDPSAELPYVELGRLYKRLEQFEKSVRCYKMALEVSRSNDMIKSRYATEAGISTALLKQPKLAIQWWKKAASYCPRRVTPYLNIALTCEELGDLETAERCLLKAQTLNTKDSRLIYHLARVYSKRGAWEKALGQYQRQLSLNAADPWCHNELATCYLQLGNRDKVLQHLEQTSILDPTGEAGQYARTILGQMASVQ